MSGEVLFTHLQDALAGREGAFEKLFASVEPDVRRIVSMEFRSRPDVDMEEVIQEVRIYLNDKLGIYDKAYGFDVFARGLTRTIVKRFVSPAGPRLSSLDTLSETELHLRERYADDRAQRASGYSRLNHSGLTPPPSGQFLNILELLFSQGGYPHQVISFSFNVLVFGRAKKTRTKNARLHRTEVIGDPEKVVSEIGEQTLEASALELELEIERSLGASYNVRRLTSPLFDRLLLTGGELWARDSTSKRHLSHLLENRAGGTRLEDYFGKDPRKSVTDWSYTVRKRLERAVGGRSFTKEQEA